MTKYYDGVHGKRGRMGGNKKATKNMRKRYWIKKRTDGRKEKVSKVDGEESKEKVTRLCKEYEI